MKRIPLKVIWLKARYGVAMLVCTQSFYIGGISLTNMEHDHLVWWVAIPWILAILVGGWMAGSVAGMAMTTDKYQQVAKMWRETCECWASTAREAVSALERCSKGDA
jgi:hypothetical protein